MMEFIDEKKLPELMDAMVRLGFVHPLIRDEEFNKLWERDESWFGNGVVEFKIIHSSFRGFEFLNFRNIQHEYIDELMQIIR